MFVQYYKVLLSRLHPTYNPTCTFISKYAYYFRTFIRPVYDGAGYAKTKVIPTLKRVGKKEGKNGN